MKLTDGEKAEVAEKLGIPQEEGEFLAFVYEPGLNTIPIDSATNMTYPHESMHLSTGTSLLYSHQPPVFYFYTYS